MKKNKPILVPERLRDLMEARGLGQSELGRRLGITQGGVYSMLVGKSKRPTNLKELAEALSTSQEYLLGVTDDPDPAPSASDFFSLYEQLPVPVRRDLYQEALRLLKEPKRK